MPITEMLKTEDIFEAKSIGNQGYEIVNEAAINVIRIKKLLIILITNLLMHLNLVFKVLSVIILLGHWDQS